MRKGTSGETQRTSSTIDVLVTQTEHDLGQIRLRTFGLCSDHFIDAVKIGRDLLGDDFLHSRESIIQGHVDVVLKGVDDSLTSLMEVLTDDLLLISVLIQDFIVILVDILDLVRNVTL